MAGACFVAAAAIGPDWRLMRQALLVSFPGADGQQWHVDGGHLSANRHLPCHAMNVFIALDVRRRRRCMLLQHSSCCPRWLCSLARRARCKVGLPILCARFLLLLKNTKIPQEITLDMGPTELRPASQFLTRNLGRQMMLAKVGLSRLLQHVSRADLLQLCVAAWDGSTAWPARVAPPRFQREKMIL